MVNFLSPHTISVGDGDQSMYIKLLKDDPFVYYIDGCIDQYGNFKLFTLNPQCVC